VLVGVTDSVGVANGVLVGVTDSVGVANGDSDKVSVTVGVPGRGLVSRSYSKNSHGLSK